MQQTQTTSLREASAAVASQAASGLHDVVARASAVGASLKQSVEDVGQTLADGADRVANGVLDASPQDGAWATTAIFVAAGLETAARGLRDVGLAGALRFAVSRARAHPVPFVALSSLGALFYFYRRCMLPRLGKTATA